MITFGSNTKRGDYPGSCGVIVPNTEVKIIATDDGRELDQGETGEILARGPQVRTRTRRERSASEDLRYGPGRDGRDLRQRTSGTDQGQTRENRDPTGLGVFPPAQMLSVRIVIVYKL